MKTKKSKFYIYRPFISLKAPLKNKIKAQKKVKLKEETQLLYLKKVLFLPAFSFLFLNLPFNFFLERNSLFNFPLLPPTPFSFKNKAFAEEKSKKNLKTLKEAETQQRKNQKEAAHSQSVISQLEKERRALLIEYRIILSQTENMRRYNEQLEKSLKSQEEEIESIKVQMDSLKQTQIEIVPFILRMVETLEQFIKLDTPFLKDERRKRVQELKAIMNSAKVSSSEKFRRVMEAYQIEHEYGRTLEAYRGLHKIDERTTLTVDFLRLGRVVLLYQSLDGKKRGLWDQNLKKWVPLGRSYRDPIKKALRVARKERAPDILKLPIPAPSKGTSISYEMNSGETK